MKEGIIRNQDGEMIVSVEDSYRFINEMQEDIKSVGEVKLSSGKYLKYIITGDLGFTLGQLFTLYLWKGYNLYIKIDD